MNTQPIHFKKGFSLVELLVGVSVFLVIIVSVYGAYTSIFNIVFTSRAKIDAVDLVNEQLEIIRNLPYSDVGIVSGIPVGRITHVQNLVRDGSTFTVTTTIRNIDDPFDGTLGGTPNDTSPSDFKLVEIEIGCVLCKNFKPIIVTTRVAPKNLETASTNGALFVKVFDANGNPVSDASVHIENNQVVPKITIDDTTNVQGMLQIVDVPPGVNAYEITVTKTGFSTDKTYSSSVSNPNPTKPHATVALQQVTQVSFSIDALSTISFTSQTPLCTAVPSIDFSLTGSKTIGSSPVVYKYSQSKITNGSGTLSLGSIEWDSYTINAIDGSYDLIGINPLSPMNVSPGSTQAVQLIVAPKDPDTILVVVKDSTTGLPLSGVDVTLSKSGFSATKTTGQGFIGQTDWSGGSGVATSTGGAQYLSSDGNIDTTHPAGDIVLRNVFGDYIPSAQMISSTYDTGSQSNFQKIIWTPTDVPVQVGSPSVRFQIATNNDGGTWNFTGPDGTSATYYTIANQNINSINNNTQYIRYKLFLDTASTTYTPTVSDISFTFTSACTPPGQVYFSDLSSGSYTLHLSKTGYADQDVPVSVTSSWQSQEVIMVSN